MQRLLRPTSYTERLAAVAPVQAGIVPGIPGRALSSAKRPGQPQRRSSKMRQKTKASALNLGAAAGKANGEFVSQGFLLWQPGRLPINAAGSPPRRPAPKRI